MSDDGRNALDLTAADEQLALRLERLGPLIRELERAETEIDPGFAQKLRAHLVTGEDLAPRPSATHGLWSRFLRQPGTHAMRTGSRSRRTAWIAAACVAFAALLAVVVAVLVYPNHTNVPSFRAPQPTRADLVFSFPAPSTVVRRLTATVSLVHLRTGVPYAGHLRLSARHLPTSAPKLRAYRLAPPLNVATVGRKLLAIRSHVRRVFVGAEDWEVAADGGFPSRHPLHSLAVSLTTGELIYHDRRNFKLARAGLALGRPTALAVARHWLTQLGWPGTRMPLIGVHRVRALPKVREVEFGWIGVGATATPAATLWVTPDRSVVEAWVWPPVTNGGVIATRSIAAAWTDVRTGKLPLAVEGVSPTTPSNGVGTLRRTTVVSVLTPGRSGSLFLVPTYRFEGRAKITGENTHTWFSLAPSAQK